MTDHLQPRLRVLLAEAIAIGPGKAELLRHIREEGSISAAARAMNMSYRRAWLLVDTMNHCFLAPVVSTATGGSHGGQKPSFSRENTGCRSEDDWIADTLPSRPDQQGRRRQPQIPDFYGPRLLPHPDI